MDVVLVANPGAMLGADPPKTFSGKNENEITVIEKWKRDRIVKAKIKT